MDFVISNDPILSAIIIIIITILSTIGSIIIGRWVIEAIIGWSFLTKECVNYIKRLKKNKVSITLHPFKNKEELDEMLEKYTSDKESFEMYKSEFKNLYYSTMIKEGDRYIRICCKDEESLMAILNTIFKPN